jgi:hypothetical protein
LRSRCTLPSTAEAIAVTFCSIVHSSTVLLATLLTATRPTLSSLPKGGSQSRRELPNL